MMEREDIEIFFSAARHQVELFGFLAAIGAAIYFFPYIRMHRRLNQLAAIERQKRSRQFGN